jgi:hypothetical protein
MADKAFLDWKSIAFGAVLGCVLYGYFLAPQLIWSQAELDQIHKDKDPNNKTAWRKQCPASSVAVSGSCILNSGSGHLQNFGAEGDAWSCVWSDNQPNVTVAALCYSNARLAKLAEVVGLSKYLEFPK